VFNVHCPKPEKIFSQGGNDVAHAQPFRDAKACGKKKARRDEFNYRDGCLPLKKGSFPEKPVADNGPVKHLLCKRY
jgi:hypothetical protein